MLLLVDGMPLTRQDASGSLPLEQLMLDQVERIEIVRGNVSAIYGSGAIGGVVQVFTRHGDGAPSATIGVGVGARDTGRLSAALQGASGATRYSLVLSGFHTAGFSALNPQQVPTANPDNDGYRNKSFSLSLSHELAAGHALSLQWQQSDGHTDYDTPFATPTDTQRQDNTLSTVRVASDNRLSSSWTSRVTVYEQRDRAEAVETGMFGSDSRFVTRSQGLSWVNTVDLGADWRATAGAERQHQSIDADDGFGDVYAKSRNVDAVFAGVSGSSGAHRLQFNLRDDHIEGTGSKATGYLGYGYTFAPGWSALASVSSAFNAPPLGYLYAPFFGNPQLKPERARSGEAGLQYAAGGQLVRVTYFDSHVQDQLQYDTSTGMFENVAQTRNRGLEMSARGRVGATDWRASLTSQDPIDESTGQRLLRRSRLLASASVFQRMGRWTLGGNWHASGDRVDLGDKRLGGYGVLDVTAQFKLTEAWQAYARIENVGDVRYQTAYGYNQTPRGCFVGLRWNGLL